MRLNSERYIPKCELMILPLRIWQFLRYELYLQALRILVFFQLWEFAMVREKWHFERSICSEYGVCSKDYCSHSTKFCRSTKKYKRPWDATNCDMKILDAFHFGLQSGQLRNKHFQIQCLIPGKERKMYTDFQSHHIHISIFGCRPEPRYTFVYLNACSEAHCCKHSMFRHL